MKTGIEPHLELWGLSHFRAKQIVGWRRGHLPGLRER